MTTVNIFGSSTVEMCWRNGWTCIWSEKSISVTIVWSVPSSRLDLAMSENDYSPVLKGWVKKPNGYLKRPSLPPITEYFKKSKGGRNPTFPSRFFVLKNGYFLAPKHKCILFVSISLALLVLFKSIWCKNTTFIPCRWKFFTFKVADLKWGCTAIFAIFSAK